MLTTWFLNLLEKIGRKRVITDRAGESPYLVRYYLWHPRGHEDGTKQDEQDKRGNIFLHNFRSSDEPYPHDHPWAWGRWIIKGGYYEYTPETGKLIWHGRWSFKWKNKATALHYVILDPNVDTWTIFWHWKRERKWGFVDEKDGNKWYERDAWLAKVRYGIQL